MHNNNNNLQIEMPAAARKILNELKSHGYEAYIVGGCVRDALLGRTPGDWDITTSALPLEVKSLFHSTVDTGIQHGTVMVILGGEGYEVTTYRIDGEYKDNRHPEQVTFTRSLEEDLKRRDFTINAFAWDENGLVDLFNGYEDLRNKVIRCVGDPKCRFKEDALRIMRAVRFSAQLGFTIEEETKKMAGHYAPNLADVSMERIRVEWEKTLLSDNPCLVNVYRELNMHPYIVPTYYEGCFDPGHDHLLETFCERRKAEAADKEYYRRLLLASFFLNLTDKEASAAMRTLKYDNKTRDAVAKILLNKDISIPAGRIELKQLLHMIGAETLSSVLELQELCDPREQRRKMITELSDVLEKGEAWSLAQLAITGSDLIKAGIPAGKNLGDVLENILQKVIVSPTLNDRGKLCNLEFLAEVQHECKSSI